MHEWIDFWWLIFPVMFFVFGGFNRLLSYRRHRDNIELLRTYATQGKDPPPEVTRMVYDPDNAERYAHGWGGFGGRCGRGPYWEWRRVFVYGSLATGFGLASYFAREDGAHDGFFIAAVILGSLAVGSLLFALMASRANVGK